MRRVVAGFSVCIAVGLALGAVSTAGAGTMPVKHCPGRVAASRSGVTLAAGGIHLQSSTYTQRHARPVLTCRQARSVVQAYLTAKLYRPLGQCTVPAEKGQWCHVDHWLCAANVSATRNPSPDQECARAVLDHSGRLRRLTYIYFRETDSDHA